MTVRRFTCDDPDYDLWDSSYGMFVRFDDYERLQLAAKKALEALEWSWGGEPLPTLEIEAIELLKKELEG